MAQRPLTVLFMPESAYGPTNQCVGIGDVLRKRGHRVVFSNVGHVTSPARRSCRWTTPSHRIPGCAIDRTDDAARGWRSSGRLNAG